MNYKKYIKIILFLLIVLGFNLSILICINYNYDKEIQITYNTLSDKVDSYQVYYSEFDGYGEEQSIIKEYSIINEPEELLFKIPKETKFLRIDLGTKPRNVWIKDLKLKYKNKVINLDNYISKPYKQSDDIYEFGKNGEWTTVSIKGNDPFIVLDLSNMINVQNIDNTSNVMNIIMCVAIDLILLISIKLRKKFKDLLSELFNNKYLIKNLAYNDFKTKYAGSYLGVCWAFVQPIVTTLIYWFVFEVGFKAAPAATGMPYALWLIAGIVPWFFFAEGVMNATNSLLEYSYLVKKVVFKISILPIVKIFSALFVHLFFVGLVLIIFILYGHIPSINFIQILYYMFCTFVLVLAISYITCSIIVFFRDLGQIVNVVLQIGMWLTPVMWNINMIDEKYHWILKLNPMYYIVEGYRDCFINNVWFWQKYMQTSYFWIFTIGCFFIGIIIFKRLKKHFADVL